MAPRWQAVACYDAFNLAAMVCTLASAHRAEVLLWDVGPLPIGAADTGGWADLLRVRELYRTPRPAAAMNGIQLFGWSNAVIVH